MLTYFKLFFDSEELLEPLDDAERGRLFSALLRYARTGEVPALSGGERYIFPVFRQQLDRDRAEYEQLSQRRRANGAKGGRPRKCQEPDEENQVVFSETEKTQDKDQDQDKDKGQGQDKDEGKDKDGGAAGAAVAAVAAAWEERMGRPLSPRARGELAGFVEDVGTECCLRAFDAALDAGKSTWAYARGILASKQRQGVRSPEDWDRLERQRQGARGKSCCGPGGDPRPDPDRARRSSDWLEKFLAGEGDPLRRVRAKSGPDEVIGPYAPGSGPRP